MAILSDKNREIYMSTKGINTLGLGLVAAAAGLLAYGNLKTTNPVELLNVSYDPTREVYSEIDSKFVVQFQKDNGTSIDVKQSHGGSTRQAKAVADGLGADVVTLGVPSDIESLHKFGLVADDWQKAFPNKAEPYTSTIVFVVRKGNPHDIHDWADLAGPGVVVVTPNPKTSANGKLSFLAAWGSVIYRGGTEDQARDLVNGIYQNVSTLGSGSRDSTNTFELAKEGDVHLTWENEAIREVADSKGDLEIVYPPVSIAAEPSVAIVAPNAAKHHVEKAAAAYLNYLYSDEAQEIFAKNGYRPSNPQILAKHQDSLPAVTLFPITLIAKDWNDAQTKFFDEGGVFDVIHQHLAKNN
jgi:sulfate/thiosulfate transport system substrate-binding protein